MASKPFGFSTKQKRVHKVLFFVLLFSLFEFLQQTALVNKRMPYRLSVAKSVVYKSFAAGGR